MDQFEKDLLRSISKLPINEETGKKHCVLFITNSGYDKMTKNAICSLLHTRVINAAIQAFSQLFAYIGSGNRGRMIEVVLGNMKAGTCLIESV